MKKLLGVGGTNGCFEALEHTIERAHRAGDEVTVVIIDDPASEYDLDEVKDKVREIVGTADVEPDVRRLHENGDEGGDENGDAHDSASRLVELAEREGFDAIVLGNSEKSPMGKRKIREVAEFVLLNSNVSVKLVR